jgi:ArsR family transcriptional regulator
MTPSWNVITDLRATELQDSVPAEPDILAVAEIFRVLGDPTRVRILSLLESEDLCVNDISRLVGMQQTAVSHQLQVLRHNRLVKYRRDGRLAIYSLDDEHVSELLRVALHHVKEPRI